mmetsp:Transcript_18219/g.42709  ORF Transcript_18219/g.42709 Transcript_18219/m.42709 type:complete len:278 (-) Transcript_18219:245-1078(-)
MLFHRLRQGIQLCPQRLHELFQEPHPRRKSRGLYFLLHIRYQLNIFLAQLFHQSPDRRVALPPAQELVLAFLSHTGEGGTEPLNASSPAKTCPSVLLPYCHKVFRDGKLATLIVHRRYQLRHILDVRSAFSPVIQLPALYVLHHQLFLVHLQLLHFFQHVLPKRVVFLYHLVFHHLLTFPHIHAGLLDILQSVLVGLDCGCGIITFPFNVAQRFLTLVSAGLRRSHRLPVVLHLGEDFRQFLSKAIHLGPKLDQTCEAFRVVLMPVQPVLDFFDGCF